MSDKMSGTFVITDSIKKKKKYMHDPQSIGDTDA